MNSKIRNEILNNAGVFPLNEMAAKELAQVEAGIRAGKFEEAAKKYLELGGSPSSSGISKTINSYLKKHPDSDPKAFEHFRTMVVQLAAKEGIKDKRPETYKTGTSGITRKGEEIKVSGIGQQARLANVLKVIDKQKTEIDKERALLDAGTDVAALRNMAKEFISDMSDKKPAEMHEQDRQFIETLRAFWKTGADQERAIDVMHTIVDEGEKVLTALKRRVAAGGMVKPNEQKLLAQAEKYKRIDVAKAGAAKEIEALKQKQLETKNEDTLYENYLSEIKKAIINYADTAPYDIADNIKGWELNKQEAREISSFIRELIMNKKIKLSQENYSEIMKALKGK